MPSSPPYDSTCVLTELQFEIVINNSNVIARRLDNKFEAGERILEGTGGQEAPGRAEGKFAPGLEKREEGQSEMPKKHETD